MTFYGMKSFSQILVDKEETHYKMCVNFKKLRR